MRTRRWLAFVLPVAWILPLVPADALADGGAYIDLDRTHFLVGSTGYAETYVWVPANKQHLFERGPFYLYITPGRARITEGRPVPSRALRLATMTIEHRRGKSFELSASFTVPDLSGDYYALGVCNDPCTISGFREPLTGEISVVQTEREAELLNERQRLEGETYGLKRQIRRGRRAEVDLERQMSYAHMEQSELSATIHELETKLANARADDDPPAFPGWFGVALAGATLVGAAGGFSVRRRGRSPGRDVPVMVERLQEAERPRVGAVR